MGTAVLELPRGLRSPMEIGSLGAFFDEAGPAAESHLGRNEDRLIRGLVHALDTYLLEAISARSASEFVESRKKLWPKYIRALRALKDTFSNLVPEKQMEKIWEQAISGLEGDIEKRGEIVFGSTLTQQALFTLWTIGQIRALVKEVLATDVAESDKQTDSKLCQEYQAASLWAQYHLDSLIAALRFNRPISEEIRSVICEGLRASANAYAIIRDAVALRHPAIQQDATVIELPWDEEDERLLASSMRDLNARSPDGR